MLHAISLSRRGIGRATTRRMMRASGAITRLCGGRNAFHSCSSCAATAADKADPTQVPQTLSEVMAKTDFGSTEGVNLNVTTTADDSQTQRTRSGETSMDVMSAKRISDEKLDATVPFDIKLPPVLHAHLAAIDTFVKPQPLDNTRMAGTSHPTSHVHPNCCSLLSVFVWL